MRTAVVERISMLKELVDGTVTWDRTPDQMNDSDLLDLYSKLQVIYSRRLARPADNTMALTVIKGTSIQDCWFKAIKACTEVGFDYVIDKGEYQGQIRKEFDHVTIHIQEPWTRPLACQSSVMRPTSDEKIRKYCDDYLLNPDFVEDPAIEDTEKRREQVDLEFKNNEYKYSTWLGPLWRACCDDLLVGKGGCNQATITLGNIILPEMKVIKGPQPEYDMHYRATEMYERKVLPDGTVRIELTGEVQRLKHPPCFRVLDMRIRYDKLHFIIYFRSWDLVSGFPENIGGIQTLKEHCLDYMNMMLEERNEPLLKDGSIIANSKGCHIYDHYFDLASDYVGPASILDADPVTTGIWIL